jgi:pimeloyl-ACP methyl ester carboxylesterase
VNILGIKDFATRRLSAFLRAVALAVCAAPAVGSSQTLGAIQTPNEPLVLKSRGSFIVDGTVVHETGTQLSSLFGPPPAGGGNITINQMYVEYMVPMRANGVPVVMLHGATLSGKSYDTTPDGRMGWYEYFVRRGHPVYVPDQAGRARSGADFAVYNDVRAGNLAPSALPNAFRLSDQLGWTLFRFGPSYGTAFADEKFPIEAAAELSRQSVPDLIATLPNPDPNIKAMADLAAQLKGAVLMGHSETGIVPLEAAQVSLTGIKGLILLEPGICQADTWTAAQIAKFAKVPILVVFADHLDVTTGLSGFTWANVYADCQKLVGRVRAAGGNAQMLHLPEAGLAGNSHVMMFDKNNLQVADLLLKWIASNANGH